MNGKQILNDLEVVGAFTVRDDFNFGTADNSDPIKQLQLAGSSPDIGMDINTVGSGVIRVPVGYEANIGSETRALVNKGYTDIYVVGKPASATLQAPGPSQDGYAITWNDSSGKFDLTTVAAGKTFRYGLTDAANIVDIGGVVQADADIYMDVVGDMNFRAAMGTNPAGFNAKVFANNDNRAIMFAGAQAKIEMHNDSFVVTANVNDAMAYAADYSGNFTTRSIPDIGWTASHLGDKLLTAIAQTPTGTQDGWVVFWDNVGGKYDLKVTSGVPGGSDTQIQFNNSGAFGGDADFTWVASTSTFGMTGGFAVTLNQDSAFDGGFALNYGQVNPLTSLTYGYSAIFLIDGSGPAARFIANVDDGVSKLMSLDMNIATESTIFTDNTTTPHGIQYNADYSAGYTSRSLVDKAYVLSVVGGGGFVTSVTGTLNRITSTGVTTPVIDIAATYVGQTSITTLGAISTGTWQGTLIGVQYGGTGSDLSATGGAGKYLKQASSGAAITVASITAAEITSGAALTKSDDTNVTLTLGGTPASALLTAASITAGWTGTLAYARFVSGAGLSVVGRSANTSGVQADITAGSDFQILRRSGTSIGFGSIDLSQAGAVGVSILPVANGGTGVSTGAWLLASGGALSGTNTISGAFGIVWSIGVSGNGSIIQSYTGTLTATANNDVIYGNSQTFVYAVASKTGVTRIGNYYNPSVTNDSSSTHLAWFSTSGSWLIGSSSANTLTSNTRLDVRGTGTTTNIIQRWADSANATRLTFSDQGVFTHTSAAISAGTNTIYNQFTTTVQTTGNFPSVAYLFKYDGTGSTGTAPGLVWSAMFTTNDGKAAGFSTAPGGSANYLHLFNTSSTYVWNGPYIQSTSTAVSFNSAVCTFGGSTTQNVIISSGSATTTNAVWMSFTGTQTSNTGSPTHKNISMTHTLDFSGSVTNVVVYGYYYAPTRTNTLNTTEYSWYSAGGSFLIGNTTSDTITATTTRLDVRGTGTTTGNTLRLASSGNVATFTATDQGIFTFTQAAQSATNTFVTWTQAAHTGGSPVGWFFQGGGHTTLTLSVEAIDVDFRLNRTVQFATGAISKQRAMVVRQPDYAFVGASTITNAASLSVQGPPSAGTNATLTNSAAIWVEIGAVGAGVTNSYGLLVNAPTGATNNYSAQFLGGLGVFLADINLVFGTTTGTKIGTNTSQKLSFWNATPIIQPTTGVAAATFVANSGTGVNDASTFDGYTLKQVVKALRNLGLLA